MIIVAISDTHQRHDEIDLPPGDVLIHAGDWTHRGRVHECLSFLKWFAAQPHPDKILICGNHEMGEWPAKLAREVGYIHYLENNSVTIHGVKFYGSPHTPEFGRWGYMTYSPQERASLWSQIPLDTDVLITHGPPGRILDACPDPAGDEQLRIRLLDVHPKVHIFGHIHEGRGSVEAGNTRFYNVSSLCGQYRTVYPATVIEVPNEKVVSEQVP
jgi:Icc-related predicted phosphoesterase